MKKFASLILIAVLLCLLPTASMAEDGFCKVQVLKADGTLAEHCAPYIANVPASHNGDYCIHNNTLHLHKSDLVVKASSDGAPINMILPLYYSLDSLTLTLDHISLNNSAHGSLPVFFSDVQNTTLHIKGETSLSSKFSIFFCGGNLSIHIAEGASLSCVSGSPHGCISAGGDLSIYGSNMYIDGEHTSRAIGAAAVDCGGKFTLNGSNITIHASDIDDAATFAFPGSGIRAESGVEINGDNITITGASFNNGDGGHGIACHPNFSYMAGEGGDVIINGNNITILGGSATVSAEPPFSPQAGYAIAAKNIAITGYNFQASSGAGGVGSHEALYTEGSLILGTPAEESADQRVWTPTTQSTLRFFRTLPLPVSHPATGDEANLALWGALLLLSAVTLVSVARKARKA